MKWTKISPEIYRENGDYIIPYIKSVEGPVNAVDMFGTVAYYKSITYELAIKKEWMGIYPDLFKSQRLFDEFAVFECNDWDTWQGQEFGFRFPMHAPKNWATVYTQHSYGSLLWFDIPFWVKDIEKFHKYKMVTERYDSYVIVTFYIDNCKIFWFRGKNFNSPTLPVLCAHTRWNEDFGYHMKLRGVEVQLCIVQ